MKKWLILLFAIALVVAGWYFARQQEMVPIWAQPKYGQVTRGDIRVPITAAGLIHAREVIEVKSMASGRITAVPVVEGDFVRANEPVVVLDPIDEERARDRAKAELDRAEALLLQAQVAVERAAVGITTARARLDEITAQLEYARYQLELSRGYKQHGQGSETEIRERDTQVKVLEAQQIAAGIAVRTAELAKADAEAAVRSQTAVVEATRNTLEDAEKRLRETTVLAPKDAIVTDIQVRPGMLVQSATGSFMGGTLLMTIADVEQKEVVARLDESDYGRVLQISPVDALPDMPGLRESAQASADDLARRSGIVKITVDAFPDQEFEGRIERVEPQGRMSAPSTVIQFDVRVAITDPRRHMLPLGAQAQVEFTVESATGALLVPVDAVKTLDEQRGVYIKAPPDPGSGEKFGKRFVPCRFGISDGERTQILAVLDGELPEGTEVYTKLPPKPEENE